jgi:hypothetical protein
VISKYTDQDQKESKPGHCTGSALFEIQGKEKDFTTQSLFQSHG